MQAPSPRDRAFAAQKLAGFFSDHYRKEIDSLIAERDLRVSDSTRILAELLLIRSLLEKTSEPSLHWKESGPFREIECPWCDLLFRVYCVGNSPEIIREADHQVGLHLNAHIRETHGTEKREGGDPCPS